MDAELVVTVRSGSRTLLINAPLDGSASDVTGELRRLLSVAAGTDVGLATSLTADATVLHGHDRLLPHAHHPNVVYAVTKAAGEDWTAPPYEPAAAAEAGAEMRLPAELLEYVRGMKPTAVIM